MCNMALPRQGYAQVKLYVRQIFVIGFNPTTRDENTPGNPSQQ